MHIYKITEQEDESNQSEEEKKQPLKSEAMWLNINEYHGSAS